MFLVIFINNINCNDIVKITGSKEIIYEYTNRKIKTDITFLEFNDCDSVIYGKTIKEKNTLLYGFRLHGLYFMFDENDYNVLFNSRHNIVVYCKLFHNVSVEISEIYYEMIVEKIDDVLLLYNTFNGQKTFFLRIDL